MDVNIEHPDMHKDDRCVCIFCTQLRLYELTCGIERMVNSLNNRCDDIDETVNRIERDISDLSNHLGN